MKLWVIPPLALAFVSQPGSGQVGGKTDNGGAGKAVASPSPIDNPVTPINKPDYFAWQLFAYVNAPAPVQTKINVGGKMVTTNSALWESWASDDHTFGKRNDPPPDPKNPPKWPEPGQARRLQLDLFQAWIDGGFIK